MPRIRVDPEELREIARQIAQASANLQESRNRVQQNWGRLDASGWYGAHRARVESRWGSCQSQIATVAAQLFDLSQWLYESAAALEEADRASSQDIARLDSLVQRFRDAVMQSRRMLEALSHQGWEALQRVLRLGGIIGGTIPGRILPIPTIPQLPWRFPALPSPDVHTRVELERLLKTLWALKPVFVWLILRKSGLSTVKDVLDLLQTQKYMEQMDQALEAWQEARTKYGHDSPQALEAETKYYYTYENMPILGPFIKALLDMGKANPVISE